MRSGTDEDKDQKERKKRKRREKFSLDIYIIQLEFLVNEYDLNK